MLVTTMRPNKCTELSQEGKNTIKSALKTKLTVYTCRLNKQQKYQDTIRLLHDGAVLLLQHKQFGSGSDLANYMIDTYKLANVPVDETSLGLLNYCLFVRVKTVKRGLIYLCIRPCC